MINNTLYLNTESTRKQLSMPMWAYSALKSMSKGSFTKGLVAYEALMLANNEYRDELTEIEDNIDDQIRRRVGTPSLAQTKERKNQLLGQWKENLVENGDPEATADHVDIYLPDNLLDQLTMQRGLGNYIAEALETLYELPFESRTERMQAKQQMLNVSEGLTLSDPHPLVEAIINDDSSDYVGVREARIDWGLDDEVWYSRDTITIPDLIERGDEIPQKPRAPRIDALETALKNSDERIGVGKIRTIVQDAFGISSDKSINSYLSELNIEGSVTNIRFVSETIRGLANQVRQQTSAFDDKPDYETAGYRPEIMEIDGTYATPEDAIEALKGAKSLSKDNVGKRISCQKAMTQRIDTEIERLENKE